jgi:carbon storage regulator
MLVLARKVGEKILIGDNISVTVVRIAPGVVRIGIEAPGEMPVIREEIQGQVRQANMPKENANQEALVPRKESV